MSHVGEAFKEHDKSLCVALLEETHERIGGVSNVIWFTALINPFVNECIEDNQPSYAVAPLQ